MKSRKSKKTKPLVLHRLYKGGGGDTVDSIPEWAVPYIKNVGNETEAHYKAGDLGTVAGVNPNLQAAFGGGARAIADSALYGTQSLANQANILDSSQARLGSLASSGGFDPAGLRQKAIDEAKAASASDNLAFGQAGTLGSARQAVRAGARDASLAGALGEIDLRAADTNFRNRLAAEGAIGTAAGQQAGLTTTGMGLTTTATKSLSALGAQEREIEDADLGRDWQALSRYASTIYGNPARQQQTSGGK
jgi:hypothetical protein